MLQLFANIYHTRGSGNERILARTIMKSVLSRWLPPLIWALLIFLISANPDPYKPLPTSWETSPALPINPAVESYSISRAELLGRYLHIGEYLVLAILITRALAWGRSFHFLLLLGTFGLSAIYALLDEIHQLFIPGRAFQLLDLSLDIFGAIIGLVLYSFFRQKKERPREPLPK